MNKSKLFFCSILFGLVLSLNATAQSIDANKLPKYVVVAIADEGFIDRFSVDIRIRKKTKYADELKRLEQMLEKSNTPIELFNKMDEIGFDFLEAYKSEKSGIQNLIFRKNK